MLIAECLETSELIDLQILATELHLTCLIEVHDLDSLMRVRDHVVGFPTAAIACWGSTTAICALSKPIWAPRSAWLNWSKTAAFW